MYLANCLTNFVGQRDAIVEKVAMWVEKSMMVGAIMMGGGEKGGGGALVAFTVEFLRPWQEIPWFLFVLMASNVLIRDVGQNEFVLCYAEDFEA